ncbi:putative amino acid-proton symporter YbeC [Candidatus Hydrogenisulfobacillus filiaventi]|uniref:Putative amino acid-proton symporter YbeC n=1 Tax=Candidatus Hydrogenisulfobacillus filiaventi TaxID=2707344 RepID=A0A6F8ZL79_9FIRM|nr:putative amino acid-proton symporter YbeC [Candidatus Hydrogenisulfobacillus filiaventi]
MASKYLKHELGLLDLTMASMGAIIGSGWLLSAPTAASVAGPAAILSWVIGGVAVMLIGLVYAELGGMLPESGGIARYPQFSHGHLTGFIMGWAAWIAYASVPAVEAEAVMQYASRYVPGLWNSHASLLTGFGLVLAALLLVAFFLINYFGVRTFANVNTPLTLIKFIMPTLTILVFLFVGLHGSNFHADGGFMAKGSAGVMEAVATSGIVFAYLGFRQAVDLAGEARNPQRDVPRAVILSIILGIILYVMLQVVFTGAVPQHDLSKGWDYLPKIFQAPFAQLASTLGLGWLAVLLYADAVVSPGGTGNIYIASTTRVIYALANNGYFPRGLAKVDPRTGIPVGALVLALIMSLLYLLPFPSWQSLVGVVSAATVLTYIIGPVAASVLRRTAPDAHRPFRLGALGFWAPVAFIIGSLIIYWSTWAVDSKLLIAVLIGIVLYALAAAVAPRAIDRPTPQTIRAGIWLVVYLLAISYFGAGRFGAAYNGGKGLIHYPLDLVVVAVMSLIFYYWGVASGIETKDTQEALEAIAETRTAEVPTGFTS